jgi:hypothetical protein
VELEDIWWSMSRKMDQIQFFQQLLQQVVEEVGAHLGMIQMDQVVQVEDLEEQVEVVEQEILLPLVLLKVIMVDWIGPGGTSMVEAVVELLVQEQMRSTARWRWRIRFNNINSRFSYRKSRWWRLANLNLELLDLQDLMVEELVVQYFGNY